MATVGLITGPIKLAVNVAAQYVPVTLVDQSDQVTLEAGVSSPTIQISKSGGSYASASDGTWAELGNGDYTVKLNATDTNTEGWLWVRVIKTGTTAESKVLCHVGVSPADERRQMLEVRTIHRETK
tara:strand:- start:630 stop:1007 length:378 start_codon:yes stop_codon:yes gene_type:complete